MLQLVFVGRQDYDHVAVRAVCDVCSVINSGNDVFVCSAIAH